jgi:hypothetical protein
VGAVIAAAASEPQRGWGGPVALLAALALFWLFREIHQRKIINRSPTPPATADPKAITAGRARFTPAGGTTTRRPDPTLRPRDPRRDPTPGAFDPGVDTDPPLRETEFPGRDTEGPAPDPGTDTWYGRIVESGGRRFRAAAHIARTGDSPPPEPEPEPRDDFDDALDLVAEPEPNHLDDWLEWAAGLGYNERVRRAVARFGVSESKVKRRIRDMTDREEEA